MKRLCASCGKEIKPFVKSHTVTLDQNDTFEVCGDCCSKLITAFFEPVILSKNDEAWIETLSKFH